jgi:hypothetical protein
MRGWHEAINIMPIENVENYNLQIDTIPSVQDEVALIAFAHTFDAYSRLRLNRTQAAQYRRPIKCAFLDTGAIPTEITLTQLRACLFIEWRMFRFGTQSREDTKWFFGDPYVVALVDAIRQRISNKQIA